MRKNTFRERRSHTTDVASLVLATTIAAFVFAAPSAVAAGSASGPATAKFPWESLIVPAVPLLIAALKLLVPKIPRAALPIMAPLLGAALDIAASYLGSGTANPVWGAVLGAAGVGLREIVDQMRKLGAAPPAKS